jgi:opacity protein-like surface antigen
MAVSAWSGFYIGGNLGAASKATSSAGKKIDVSENQFVVFSADGLSGGNNDTGFVVGGGIDYKIAPRLSLGVEGRRLC